MKDNVPVLTQCQEKDAPWEQVDPEPINVDCCVSYSMSKTMPVRIEHYDVNDGEPDFTDTNFLQEFAQDPHAFSIPGLLKILEALAEGMIEKLMSIKEYDDTTSKGYSRTDVGKYIRFYKDVIKATKGWVVDDLEVMKED